MKSLSNLYFIFTLPGPQAYILLTPLSVTDWMEDHPGGSDIILSNRSKDVTPIFQPRHPSDQLEEANIPPTVQHLGTLDVEGASDDEKAELRLKVAKGEEEEGERIKREREEMEERGLGVIVNMRDFEVCPICSLISLGI